MDALLRQRRLAALMAARAAPVSEADAHVAGWSLANLQGRLVELRGVDAGAELTFAFVLALEGQRRGEPVAWVMSGRGDAFFPPDVAAHGLDLDALVVVRAPEAQAAGRAVDQLARSGAFA